MIKLLIVDDSALMRRQLTTLFESEGGFEIQPARNGLEAVELNQSFAPDVVLLDINMPEMDGLTALSIMMAERPVRVVMLSSLTEKGALVTFEALALGAVDYLAKPDGTISLSLENVKDELLKKIRGASRARLAKPKVDHKSEGERGHGTKSEATVAKPQKSLANATDLVIIGVSTGGPRTLEEILPHLPADFPSPIVVAQHMPAGFTLSFASRMNDLCPMVVSELSRVEPLEPGHIYICKGSADARVALKNNQLVGIPKPQSDAYLWHPSVELLGQSVLAACDPKKVIAVMLTGMGSDGSEAFAAIKEKGGRVIAESEASSVVFGMPAELIKLNGATTVLNADQVASKLIEWTQ